MVGPGVANNGLDTSTWTDHTDIVPTTDALLGLRGDYQPDGRVITQALAHGGSHDGREERSHDGHDGDGHGDSITALGDVYKQLDAPYGDFAHSLIVASTNGIKADDATYLKTEQQIQQLAAQRDAIVQRMKDVLDGSEEGHGEQLIRDGNRLLQAARDLAGL
jgi:hypothetical protein